MYGTHLFILNFAEKKFQVGKWHGQTNDPENLVMRKQIIDFSYESYDAATSGYTLPISMKNYIFF